MKAESPVAIRLARILGPGAPVEVTCEECFNLLDRFVESELAGVEADAFHPGMRAHLEGCGACREEHDALLAFLYCDERDE